MKCGTAEIGSWIVANTCLSTGVHDPLYARALVLSDDNAASGDAERVAIVALDVVGLSWDLGDELRAGITKATGIKTVLINFSHTHNAPMLYSGEPDTDRELERSLGDWLERLRTALASMW